MSVPREEPVVALQIFHSILKFTVFGFVGFFDDVGSPGACVRVMGLNILNEDGEALCCAAEFGGTRLAGAGGRS